MWTPYKYTVTSDLAEGIYASFDFEFKFVSTTIAKEGQAKKPVCGSGEASGSSMVCTLMTHKVTKLSRLNGSLSCSLCGVSG